MRQTHAAAAPPSEASLATDGDGVANGGSVGVDLSAGRELVDSYRRLADVFHHVLSEHSLDTLLERIADTLADLIPYDTLSIFQADEAQTVLVPVLARDRWADEIMRNELAFGAGLAGWAAARREPVLTNTAHLDERTAVVPGTPSDEEEALIAVPLIARDAVKGVLSIYRLGDEARFEAEELELAKRFGDAAALALDNAHIRARLELQAQTDSLTGLYNHRYFHDALRAELTRSSRSGEAVALLMLDIDDFKKVNDICGHGVGDQMLRELAEHLRETVRASDVVCRLGGEEFGVVMGSCASAAAMGLAARLRERLRETEFGAAGTITVSVGVAEGPTHASNPRELIACAEAAMMTAKARGKDRIVLFDETTYERPKTPPDAMRDVRSIAHLKVLQSLAGKLNRLTDVGEIGAAIVDELRGLVDYHTCRISLIEGDEIVPIAFRGDLGPRRGDAVRLPGRKVGDGIIRRAAEQRKPLLIGNARDGQDALPTSGTGPRENSLLAVPLRYGSRVVAVIGISKLGRDQFDDDDVRLLEVLGAHAAVALENARRFESQQRETDHLKELLDFSVEALATALEADDADRSDTRWIKETALRVGSTMGLGSKALKRLELGALFHDVGKIGIPASILLKPGPLTAKERRIVQQHAELGERILAPIERLNEVPTIVRSCHEHYDGSGYPDGKARDAIPLEARIILVCGAFRAMTTDRPYRERLSAVEACERLREAAGTQFDPNVVGVFLALHGEV